MLLAVDWKVFLICAVLFLSIFAVTHYVSLASIVTYVAALIVFIAFGAMGFYGMDYAHTVEMDIVMAFLTVLAIYRHRTNISRLLKGNENKVYLKK
jgi:glycerol-3-phosphate acyltransferase PlsY